MIVTQSAQAVRSAQNTKQNGEAPLNVGYAWGLFHSLVPEVIGRFHRKAGNVAVNLFDMTAPQQTVALMEGRLDVGFIGFDRDAYAPSLTRRKIGPCALLLALPKSHCRLFVCLGRFRPMPTKKEKPAC